MRFVHVLGLCLVLAAPCAQAFEGRAAVIDGDTLDLGGTRVRLHGIDAPEANQMCRDARGKPWACGAFATRTLRDLARGPVACTARDTDRYGRTVATCSAGGQDIGAAMVARGAAFAYRKYSQAYAKAEARAEAAGVGIWSGEAERPDRVRAAARAAAPVSAPACAIKGNISGGGAIYHLPGQEHYADTRIDPGRGERWFCSEAEARAAGWRRARR